MIDLAQKLLSLTQQMLESAKAGTWPEVEALQMQREALLKAFDALTPDTDARAVAELRTLLEAAQALEAECLQLAEDEKRTLAADHQKMKRGKAMKKAYGG